jgi:crotonobetainyl-CoA:carnitine CoA-transferase CaiB-like acyl-CoA transferase
MTAPLAGLLVVDLTQNIAGPYCTQILADLGAEVVKLEKVDRGDDARAWGPPFWGRESATFMSVNRGKRSLAVDVGTAEGRAIVDRLLARADVFVQSLRAGVAERLGLGAAGLRARHPRLIYCSVTAFGTEGPYRDRPGYDPLMQALGGIMAMTGHPGQPPARVPVSLIDLGTGVWAALAVVTALRERDRTGRGGEITTALYETAVALTVFHMSQYLAGGGVPGPQGSGTHVIAPYEAFPAADGWVMIAAASDALFAKTCRALGAEALAGDPRFADNPGRVAHRDALAEALAAVTRVRSTAELLARLEAAGVPCAPIQTLDQVARHPQTEASGIVAPLKHPRLPDYRAVLAPVRWDGERPAAARVAPLLGEHTAEVLGELGYDPAAIQTLAARHVIGLPDAPA